MITEQVKAKAKAQIKRNIPIEDIAKELDLPLALINEWASKLDPNDLVQQEANVSAIQTITERSEKGELVDMDSEVLRTTMEKTALDLTNSMAIPALNGDMAHAKSIELLANALSKMYHTVVLKGGVIDVNPNDTPSNKALEMFASLMKD